MTMITPPRTSALPSPHGEDCQPTLEVTAASTPSSLTATAIHSTIASFSLLFLLATDALVTMTMMNPPRTSALPSPHGEDCQPTPEVTAASTPSSLTATAVHSTITSLSLVLLPPLLRRFRAAVTIQSTLRRRWARGRLLERKRCATRLRARLLLQAGVRGWFVRRSLLSAAQLTAELAATPLSFFPGGRRTAPADLYLHHTADRLSWVYCARVHHTIELWPVADALSLSTDIPDTRPQALPRASSAKKRGLQRKAAARALRDARVERRTINHARAGPYHGFLFRPSGRGYDRKRQAWALAAADLASGLSAHPFLDPAWIVPPFDRRLRLKRRDAPFLSELRSRYGDRVIAALHPRTTRPSRGDDGDTRGMCLTHNLSDTDDEGPPPSEPDSGGSGDSDSDPDSRPHHAFRMMDENDDLMLESDWDLDLHHHPY
jgi:hypothetical protein